MMSLRSLARQWPDAVYTIERKTKELLAQADAYREIIAAHVR